MIENAKQWEGQLLNGKFPLRRFLWGADRSAVFLVEEGAGGQAQTVVRLVDANAAGADEQLKQWEAASKLSHPNLLRIFETGRCQVAGHEVLYALIEYAEENLAQILPERALTVDEARQVLEAVLAALSYMHGHGLVHGRLKPSNIFAVGDTVKVSSDTLRPAGQSLLGRPANTTYDAPEALIEAIAPPADVWSLGVTLAEVLTQQLPKFESPQGKQPILPQGIPQPFREIVENCLQVDAARRWTVAQIAARLRGEKPEAVRPAFARRVPLEPARDSTSIAPAKRQSAKWPYAIALVGAVVLALILIARPKPPASRQAETQPAPGGASTATSPSSGAGSAQAGRVAERVRPEVSGSALRTIQGKIRVQVEVGVDETGNVTEARFKSSGPSRYFAEKSLEAARRWKFTAPVEDGQAVASQWLVKFTISRSGVDESAEQIRP